MDSSVPHSGDLMNRNVSPALLVLLVAGTVLAACGTNESRTSANTNPDLLGPDGGDSGLLPDGAPINPDADGSGTDPDGLDQDGGPGPDGGGPDEDGGGGGGEPVPGGESCEDDSDCQIGTICELNFGGGFCAPAPFNEFGANCETQADCNLESSEATFCCAPFFGVQRCAPSYGEVCGTSDGTQGDSCAVGGQSDCNGESAICLFGGTDYAYCGELCQRPEFDCLGDSYCVGDGPAQPGVCVEFGETEDFAPCVDDPTACSEGAFCINPEGEGELDFCARDCVSDRDCAESDACSFIGVCLPAGTRGQGESCVEDRFACDAGLYCISFGFRSAQCTAACAGDAECDDGSYCFLTDSSGGYCLRQGDREAGEFCGDDVNSCRGACSSGYDAFDSGAYCIDTCNSDRDCSGTTYCAPAEEGGQRYCLNDGPGGQGADCTLDPFICQRDAFCLGYGTSSASCIVPCFDSTDCASGNWCVQVTEEFGYCLAAGDVAPGEPCTEDQYDCAAGSVCAGTGEPICIAICTDDPSICADNEICTELGEFGESYCYPSGDLQYGEDCSATPYECELPTYCAEAGLPNARCTSGCEGDADCPDGDWCYRAPDASYCRPAGDAGALDSCEGDQWACEAGLACILGGSTGSFCAEECTGFASSCGAGQSCTYVGYSRSFCVATGDAEAGDSCADDQFACAPGHWCAGAGTAEATCVRTCSFDTDACEDGTTCRFLASGLGLCLGAGLSPDDPLNPGGTPL